MPATFPYPSEVEATMRALYLSLRENDRGRYAAVEADRLGHGGDAYVASVLGCDPKTIRRGRDELARLRSELPDTAPDERVRKKGAAGEQRRRGHPRTSARPPRGPGGPHRRRPDA